MQTRHRGPSPVLGDVGKEQEGRPSAQAEALWISLMVPLFMEMGPRVTTTELRRKGPGRINDGSTSVMADTCLGLLRDMARTGFVKEKEPGSYSYIPN